MPGVLLIHWMYGTAMGRKAIWMATRREITSMRGVTGIFPDFWTECLYDHRFYGLFPVVCSSFFQPA